MSDVKSLNNIQIVTVCTMSDLARQWVNRKLQSITILGTHFVDDEALVNIKARISCSFFKGTLFFKKVQGPTDSWELVGMKSHIMLNGDPGKLTFGPDAETGKLLIQPR